MSEPTARPAGCCHHDTTYCSRCDLLVGLAGLHVVAVDGEDGTGLRVVVESGPQSVGCRSCGVIASSHGRREVRLVDAPCFGRPVELVWRKRTWRCAESLCPTGAFTEQDPLVAAPRALLTRRACWWAIGQIRREHASIAGLARQLGTTWNTLWSAIRPLLEAMADDESRFAGVTRLGVDEHVWHHVCERPVDQGGRKTDPLYRIRNILRAGQERLTERQQTRLETAFDADPRHVEVEVAWRCAQQLRSVYHQSSHAAGRRIALEVLDSFASCPIPEIARLGRTLRQWRREFLGYFDTGGANNGGTEAVNGLIELHRRIARGFRNLDNYRLRMLLIGGALTHPHLR